MSALPKPRRIGRWAVVLPAGTVVCCLHRPCGPSGRRAALMKTHLRLAWRHETLSRLCPVHRGQRTGQSVKRLRDPHRWGHLRRPQRLSVGLYRNPQGRQGQLGARSDRLNERCRDDAAELRRTTRRLAWPTCWTARMACVGQQLIRIEDPSLPCIVRRSPRVPRRHRDYSWNRGVTAADAALCCLPVC